MAAMGSTRHSWVRGSRGMAAALMAFSACDGQTTASEVVAPVSTATLSEPCLTLQGCCPSLPSEVIGSCNLLVKEASADECSAELQALTAAKRCLGVLVSHPDASGGVAASLGDATAVGDATLPRAEAGLTDASSAVACVLLEACCSGNGLSAAVLANCQSVQGAGDESQCASLFADLTSSQECRGVPYGAGGACPELDQCCTSASLPASFQTTCLGTQSSGDDSACYSLLMTLAPAGYCGALGSLDGGVQPTPDCVTLATCCDEETFPPSTLSTCQSITAGNEDGNCLSAYDAYVALDYCE